MTDYDEVVHVETLKEYRAVLDKWFDKGYDWFSLVGKRNPHEERFTGGEVRYLTRRADHIGYSFGLGIAKTKAMSFKEFMAKEQGVTSWVPAPEDIPEREQEVTYEVSEEQMGFIKEAKDSEYPAAYLTEFRPKEYKSLFGSYEYTKVFEQDLLKYIAGDENVVFQLKEPLYFLKGKNNDGDNMYFTLDSVGAPTYTYVKSAAFKAPHDEIVPWENPFWEIVLVDA